MTMMMIMIMIKSGRPTHGIGKTLLIGRVGEAQEIARLVFTKIKLILILIPYFPPDRRSRSPEWTRAQRDRLLQGQGIRGRPGFKGLR
jgi:hypothetical protein